MFRTLFFTTLYISIFRHKIKTQNIKSTNLHFHTSQESKQSSPRWCSFTNHCANAHINLRNLNSNQLSAEGAISSTVTVRLRCIVRQPVDPRECAFFIYPRLETEGTGRAVIASLSRRTTKSREFTGGFSLRGEISKRCAVHVYYGG